MSAELPDGFDDRIGRRTALAAPCQRCAHATLDTSTRFHQFVCPGFPNGIPVAIQLGENDHREAVEGDGGYRFKPR